MLKNLPATLVASALLVASATAMAQAPAAGAPAVPAQPPAPVVAKTIILVHGAFADGSSWDKVVPLLQAKGFTVVAIQNPLSSLADDVGAAKRAIEAATGPVVLVGHSWGGAVITEAGNNDKVSGLVYVAAFALDAGESVNDLGKGKPAPAWLGALKVDSGGFATLPAENIAKDFAQDVSAAEQKLIAVKQGPVAAKVFDEKIKTAAWKTKPSWYVVADQDRMIDPQGQALMAKRAGATVTTLKGSHVIMVSKPKDVAAVILAAAAGKKK